MKTVKLVGAWILMVLAVVGVIVVLAGFVGSWVVRNKVTTVTVNLLTVGETAVSSASDSVNRVDDRLDESVANVNEVETAVLDAGDVLKDNSVIGHVISQTIGAELAPVLNTARDTIVTVAELTFALNDAIDAANEIPFVSLDGTVPTLIQDASTGIVELNDEVTELKTELVERREGRIEGGVDVVTGLTTEISTGIQEIQGNLQAFDTELATISDELAALKVSLPRTFTMITIAVNLILLLIGIAFVSLIFHGISFIKNPDQTLSDLTGAKAAD